MFRFLFFNDTPTPEIYTLSLHDALPISAVAQDRRRTAGGAGDRPGHAAAAAEQRGLAGLLRRRSEEHTSELQSQFHLVCRLLLEKKKTKPHIQTPNTITPQFYMYRNAR